MENEEYCDYCKKNVNSTSWNCRRCGGTFCDEHRLPEDHNCRIPLKKDFFKPLANSPTPKIKNKKKHVKSLKKELNRIEKLSSIKNTKKDDSKEKNNLFINFWEHLVTYFKKYIYPK
jgi:predicted nucleic acid binding AN1-type Zn finger protein